VEKKLAVKQVIDENPELFTGLGYLGIVAFISLVVAIMFLSKIALTVTIISLGLCWMILWILKQELKEKLNKN
jgi:hypothetical protein